MVERGYPIAWLDPKGAGREQQIHVEQRLPEPVRRWEHELFGAEGTLADRVK
ncbi:hypothetical protein [Nocardia thraciensis]